MSQAMTDIKDMFKFRQTRKKEENREDNTNIQIEIPSDGTSSLRHEQTPVAASPHNENIGVNEITSEDDENDFKSTLKRFLSRDAWSAARHFYDHDPDMVRVPLTASGETALHLAVNANSRIFVEELVNRMTPQDLEIRNAEGKTAFFMAALAGNDHFMRIMIGKNEYLPLIPGPGGILPVHLAASSGNRVIVKDVCSQNLLERMDYKDIERLLFLTISSNMYELAQTIFVKYPDKLAIARDDQRLTALHMLARQHLEESGAYQKTNLEESGQLINPSDNDGLPWFLNPEQYVGLADLFLFRLLEHLWCQVRQLEYNQIVKLITEPSVVLFDAVKSGNEKFVERLLKRNGELMMIKDPNNGRSLLHYVVLYQQRSLFSFLHKMKTVDLIIRDVDNCGNNVLHFAAKQAEGTSSTSSPDTKMHAAVMWLEEVGRRFPQQQLKEMRNKKGKTPTDLFYDEHKKLFDEVKDSTKGSANSGMVVATLIATITFAAALTVPGEKTNAWFIVFVLTNAIALFTSSASVFFFLSVFTSSRFTLGEFIISLHPSLIFGLKLLFISIATMIIAFAAACFLIFDHISKWVAYVVALMGLLLISILSVLQLSYFKNLRNKYFWNTYSGREKFSGAPFHCVTLKKEKVKGRHSRSFIISR